MRYSKKLFIVLIIICSAVSGFAINEYDLDGTWVWPVPDWSNSTGRNFDWKYYTFKCLEQKEGVMYIIYDDKDNETDRGYIEINKNEQLVLNSGEGYSTIYNIRLRLDGSYEIVRYYDHPMETPIIFIEKKDVFLAREAKNLNNKKQYRKAIGKAEEAISLNYDNEEAWFQKAFALGYLRKYEECIKAYERVLEINPDEDSAKSNIIWAEKKLSKKNF